MWQHSWFASVTASPSAHSSAQYFCFPISHLSLVPLLFEQSCLLFQLTESKACLFLTQVRDCMCVTERGSWSFVIKIKRKMVLEATSFQELFCDMWLSLCGSAVMQHRPFFSLTSCNKAFVGPVSQSVWQNTGVTLGCWFCSACVAAVWHPQVHTVLTCVTRAAASPASCWKN